MELNKFLEQLRKKWLLLILLPVISMVVAFFLLKGAPATFNAQALLATGLVDETRHSVSFGNLPFQEAQVNQQFTNLVEMMKLKKILNKVSYLLIIHDLGNRDPFRKPSKELKLLSASEKERFITFFQAKYAKEEDLNLFDPFELSADKLLKSMKYDAEKIGNSINIYRKSNSDYIQVEYSSESPLLSPFVVNTLCAEFIKSYDALLVARKQQTADYLAALLRRKYLAMNEKIALLKDYKIQNKILNLYEQSKILYTNMVLVESRKLDAQKEIEAYGGAIAGIDKKFNPGERQYLEGALTKLNGSILSTKRKLQQLSDLYITSEYNEGYKKSMDSLKPILTEQINTLTDQYIYDPLTSKKDLMGQKLNLSVQKDIAQNSLNGLTRELDAFNNRFNRLVPFEAVIQSYERDIDIASREYLDILNKYNQLGISGDESVRLAQVQVAMPGQGAPTKKLLFILISGVIILVISILVLFIRFFFDKRIDTPEALANKTDKPVLGNLAALTGNSLNLGELWESRNASPEFEVQKALLRAVRFEIIQELGTGKVLCITGLKTGVGASFLAINLAYTLANMKLRVLLIDGNFNNPLITTLRNPSLTISQLFSGQMVDSEEFIVVAGNKGGNASPFEIASEQVIRDTLRNAPFDIVIIDAAPLRDDHKTREWASCSDKIVAVFEKNEIISSADEAQISWLKQTGKFAGWVFNKYVSS